MVSEAYKRYKAQGLCRRCGAAPLLGKTRCGSCHKEHLNYTKKAKHKAIKAGLCRYCLVIPHLETSSMCADCLEKHRLRGRKLYAFHRIESIKAYGGRCVCCGTSNQKYLQLDHINNDGAAHKRQLRNSQGRGGNMYKWAYLHEFPDILQLLCANCHQAKTNFGGCSVEDHTLRGKND